MKFTLQILFAMLLSAVAFAQQDQGQIGVADDSTRSLSGGLVVTSAFFADHPMARDGSGTSWHPDASPLNFARYYWWNNWRLMLNVAAFARVTAQDINDNGSRGDTEFSLPNWIMFAGQRSLSARQRFMFRSMMTLDPLTEGEDGYPQLFQTGESLDGELLIDRQHPHELLAEVGIGYTLNFSDSAGMILYAAYPGEPALGPSAFLQRPSARHNPAPPLAHHWQDATHITYGVITMGLRHQNLKFDASIFTGREPNDERFLPDRPRMDSWSLRLTANIPHNWSFQISRAFLNEPEVLFPGNDQWRTTASILYHARPTMTSNFSAALIWGLNEPVEEERTDTGRLPGKRLAPLDIDHVPPGSNLHSFLLETDFQFGRQAIFTRAEWVEKSSVDLGVILLQEEELAIGALTLGFSRKLFTTSNGTIAIGGQGTAYRIPETLHPVYGSGPFSAEAFLHFTL